MALLKRRYGRAAFLEDGDRVRLFVFEGGELADSHDDVGMPSYAALVASLTPAEASELATMLGSWALASGAHQGAS